MYQIDIIVGYGFEGYKSTTALVCMDLYFTKDSDYKKSLNV